ncbi:MAG: polysaccharide export protein [Symploca sp. SIO2B6]|nr:polysaccharide export protein [Symploca sp. SIO2B6]
MDNTQARNNTQKSANKFPEQDNLEQQKGRKAFKVFELIDMIAKGRKRGLTKSAAGLTILTIWSVVWSAPVIGQTPVLDPTQLPTQSTGVNNLPPETAYTLGAGDRVRIDIFNIPEYSGEFQVLVDGTLNLPVVGSVSVQGKTLQEASGIVSAEYVRYVKRPLVTVSLLSARPLQIVISGEVSRPGAYRIPADEGGQAVTLTQAIVQAGGVTLGADVSQVQLNRRVGFGQEQLFQLNLEDLLLKNDISQDISLRDGDKIFLPTVAQANPEESRKLADASFAAEPQGAFSIAIVGEVTSPGPYEVPVSAGKRFPTLTQAIGVAGGITQTAEIRQVEVRRRVASGQEQVLSLNLWNLLQNGDLSQDIPLQEGDTVFIPTTTALNRVEASQLAASSLAAEIEPIKVTVVGEVVRPGPYTVTGATASATNADSVGGGGGGSGLGNAPTVTQAIQVAGGITQSSDIRSIKVQRQTREGSVQEIEVDLWSLLQNGDVAEDVILQQGDTIFVPTAEAITAEEATELASASFSAAIIDVNVVGEVNRPGIVQVRANAPLNEALLAAGGFDNKRARKGSVNLVRLQPNGTVEKRKVKIDLTAGINEETNPALRPNDVIIVNRSGLSGVTDTLGTIVSPLGTFFGLLERLF